MAYIYFYAYLLLILAAVLICNHYKPVQLRHIIIGIATAAYSIAFDNVVGDWLGLYHYLDGRNSSLYMVLSGVFVYPPLNILYLLFLPESRRRILAYTGYWIAGMVLFEYLSVSQKIVIFTGWKPIPLSLATYAFVYLWINLLDQYLKRFLKPA